MKTLIALILIMASVAHGAQSITIPEGETVYGPFSINVLHRRARFEFVPQGCSNPGTKGTATIQASIDGGKTILPTSTWMRGFTFECSGQPVIARNFDMPVGTTHLLATVFMTGGSVTLKAVPAVKTK